MAIQPDGDSDAAAAAAAAEVAAADAAGAADEEAAAAAAPEPEAGAAGAAGATAVVLHEVSMATRPVGSVFSIDASEATSEKSELICAVDAGITSDDDDEDEDAEVAATEAGATTERGDDEPWVIDNGGGTPCCDRRGDMERCGGALLPRDAPLAAVGDVDDDEDMAIGVGRIGSSAYLTS